MNKLIKLTAVLLTGAILFGCSQAAAPAPSAAPAPAPSAGQAAPAGASAKPAEAPAKENVEISFLHIWPEHEESMAQAVKTYTDQNPNVKVTTTIVPWNELVKTLQTAFAAQNAPDVPMIWPERMAGYEEMGVALDLTPYMTADNSAWKNSFVASALDMGVVNDKILAVPFRATSTLLAYNKTIMDENGWTAPKTFAEFEALNAKVVEKGIVPLLTPGNPDGFQVSALLRTFVDSELYKSGKIKTKEYLTGYVSDVGNEFKISADRTRDWMNKGFIGKDSLAIKREEAQAQFFTKKGLFIFMNNNELSPIRTSAKEAGIELGYIGFPPNDTPPLLYNLGVDGFFVNKATKYPDESVGLLKAITSKEAQKAFADKTLSVMCNKEVSYDDPDQKLLAEIIAGSEAYRIRFAYQSGLINTDISQSVAEYMSTPSMTSDDLAKKVSGLYEKLIAENGKK